MSAEDLDALVRRVDEDRWLASRFAPKRVREGLVALYALNYEIARTAESVSEPGIGAIRLAWWREAIDEIYAGKTPRAHPAVQAFAALVRARPLDRTLLDALIDARENDIDPAPFASWAELEGYVEATAGGLMRLALDLCDSGAAPEALDALARHGGRAWGYAGLKRAAPHWAARGRSFAPRGVAPEATLEGLVQRSRDAHAQARALALKLPSVLFPAYGYLAFVPRYLRRDGAPLLSRQLKLVATSATGRI